MCVVLDRAEFVANHPQAGYRMLVKYTVIKCIQSNHPLTSQGSHLTLKTLCFSEYLTEKCVSQILLKQPRGYRSGNQCALVKVLLVCFSWLPPSGQKQNYLNYSAIEKLMLCKSFVTVFILKKLMQNI